VPGSTQGVAHSEQNNNRALTPVPAYPELPADTYRSMRALYFAVEGAFALAVPFRRSLAVNTLDVTRSFSHHAGLGEGEAISSRIVLLVAQIQGTFQLTDKSTRPEVERVRLE
jgi:hypothetical protein